jgi:hypothetical protein
MWPKLIAKARRGGLDVIQTYVFWNVHEPVQGQVCALSSLILSKAQKYLVVNCSILIHFSMHQYNFEGRYDIVEFIREIQAQGLYVSLRIGPFIEAEWKYGYECTKPIFTCIYSSIRLMETFDLKTVHKCNSIL